MLLTCGHSVGYPSSSPPSLEWLLLALDPLHLRVYFLFGPSSLPCPSAFLLCPFVPQLFLPIQSHVVSLSLCKCMLLEGWSHCTRRSVVNPSGQLSNLNEPLGQQSDRSTTKQPHSQQRTTHSTTTALVIC